MTDVRLMAIGDDIEDPVTGVRTPPAERHRALVDIAVHAESAGFRGIHLGQHHGVDYIVSSPPVVLAAIAARTESLLLGTSVSIMANLDPFLVAEEFSTLDALSSGRVQIAAGRGNYFGRTFALFGQDGEQARERFDEAVELFCALWTEGSLTWEGRFRAPIDGQPVQPPPERPVHEVAWVAGGLSPETVELAARLGLGLVLPTAFGALDQSRAIADLYQERFASYGHDHDPQLAASWHGFVAPTSQAARERFAPRYEAYYWWVRRGAMRANDWTVLPDSLNRPFDFERQVTTGPGIVGSPTEFMDRLLGLGEQVGASTHLVQMDIGGTPPAEAMKTIELFDGLLD